MILLVAISLLIAGAPADDFMRIFGGYVRKADTQEGFFAVLNNTHTTSISDAFAVDVESTYAIACKSFKIDIAPDISSVDRFLSERKLNAAVVIVDRVDYPVILAAPESRWTILNIHSLTNGAATLTVAKDRIRKELWRAFAYTCGCGNSGIDGCVMNKLLSVKDLDNLHTVMISPDASTGMNDTLRKLGVCRFVIATYADACQEGWAPQPTNDFQRAIWDKVHAIPDKPMKITFDPAKQKGRVTK